MIKSMPMREGVLCCCPISRSKPPIVATQCNVVHISCSFWSYNSGLRLRHLHLALAVAISYGHIKLSIAFVSARKPLFVSRVPSLLFYAHSLHISRQRQYTKDQSYHNWHAFTTSYSGKRDVLLTYTSNDFWPWRPAIGS